MASAVIFINGKLKQKDIIVFSKSYSPEGRRVHNILEDYNGLSEERFEWVNLDKRQDVSEAEDYLWKLSGKNNREMPLLFVKGRCVGGYWDILRLHTDMRLHRLITNLTLDLDDHREEDKLDNDQWRSFGQIFIRVAELDDTEVVVRVADWLHRGPVQVVDYDYFWEKEDALGTADDMPDMKLSKKKKQTTTAPATEDEVTEVSELEWMYVGGLKRHQDSCMSLDNADLQPYFMKKTSTIMAPPSEAGLTSQVDVSRGEVSKVDVSKADVSKTSL